MKQSEAKRQFRCGFIYPARYVYNVTDNRTKSESMINELILYILRCGGYRNMPRALNTTVKCNKQSRKDTTYTYFLLPFNTGN